MNKKIFKKISLSLLVIFLLVSFSFITGFTEEEPVAPQENPEETGYTKWICDECGYIYDPDEGDPENGIQPGTTFNSLPEDWRCPDCSAEIESFTEIEMLSWVCPYCGFIYDEKIEEMVFEDLAEDWECPVCQSSKDVFIISEDYDKYVGNDPDLSHLQHVLSMKSKHITVLQNVLNKHLEKDPDHSSINGLMNALSSSLKTVLKSKDLISEYIDKLMKPEDDVIIEEDNTSGAEQGDQINPSATEETKNDNSNNGKSNSKGNNSQKDKKENKNNGKAKGKNK